jgi:signal transduction histidine kinase
MAAQLRGRARTMLGIGLIGALLAALGTLVFWWMLLQREVASEALEEHSRLAALGQMSATMAHEIRNPLTSAKGHAQLLVELLEEGRAKKKAGQVVNELVRLEALTNDLLVFIRSGKLVEASASPLQLLRDAVTQVKGNIEVVDDGAPSDWNLDTSRLDRVLTNILRNAVKAGGPDVKIRARVALEDDHLVYEIRDHGPGIPLDLLATIFDPFVTSRVTGTGLGLAISRQIVEAHNGTIGAHNHPDGGAVITVRLPRT